MTTATCTRFGITEPRRGPSSTSPSCSLRSSRTCRRSCDHPSGFLPIGKDASDYRWSRSVCFFSSTNPQECGFRSYSSKKLNRLLRSARNRQSTIQSEQQVIDSTQRRLASCPRRFLIDCQPTNQTRRRSDRKRWFISSFIQRTRCMNE